MMGMCLCMCHNGVVYNEARLALEMLRVIRHRALGSEDSELRGFVLGATGPFAGSELFVRGWMGGWEAAGGPRDDPRCGDLLDDALSEMG